MNTSQEHLLQWMETRGVTRVIRHTWGYSPEGEPVVNGRPYRIVGATTVHSLERLGVLVCESEGVYRLSPHLRCNLCQYRANPELVQSLGLTLKDHMATHRGYHLLAGDKRPDEGAK